MTICVAMLAGSACSAATGHAATESFGGRSLLVYVPAALPAKGSRAMVVVLHGGLGNAQRIEDRRSESGLNMDAEAEKDGFLVVYMNGTPVTRLLGADKLGWNAGGGCCGLSAEKNVDDVSYIKGAVAFVAEKYGVDLRRVYGIGHSNGAMMTQRLMCETALYAAAISISGPLNALDQSCPSARGRQVLAIHGANDENVPVAGGRGTKGISGVAYSSEEHTRRVFTDSGAAYVLDIVPGAAHELDGIEAAIVSSEKQTIAAKAAKFFGLATN